MLIAAEISLPFNGVALGTIPAFEYYPGLVAHSCCLVLNDGFCSMLYCSSFTWIG